MNLRLTGGKIPIRTGNDRHPIMLIDPPTREVFNSLFYRGTPMARKDIYWQVLHERLAGKTLKEVGESYGITRERVRQMEAKMVRLLSTHWLSEHASDVVTLEKVQPIYVHR